MSKLITPALFTSCFGAKALIIGSGHAAIRTSLGAPRWKLAYEIAGVCREIMPDRPMLKMEYPEYWMAYTNKLESIGVEAIQKAFFELAVQANNDSLILLCFEDLTKPGLWCHRTMFSDFWFAKTGQRVLELQPAVSKLSQRQPMLFDGFE